MPATNRPISAALSSNRTMKPAGSFDRRIAVHQGVSPRLALNARTAMAQDPPSSRMAMPSTI